MSVLGVRGRVTLVATGIVFLVLGLTGAALVVSQRGVLTDNVDEVLQVHQARIADQIDSGLLGDRIADQGDDEAFAYVVDASGAIVATTEQRFTSGGIDTPPGDGAHFQTLRPEGALAFRVLSVRHGSLVIVTATPLDDVDESVGALTSGLTIAVPSASLVLAGLVWLLVGRVLRPVEEIRSQVAAIGGGSLDRRVPEPRTRDEIARLARTMNEMLARLESSSIRQRRFVADASHELRSPLTRIRTQLEVDRAHPARADRDATAQSVLDEIVVLQRLIDDLLALARADGSRPPTRNEVVDLDDLVLREVSALGPRQRTIDISGVSGAQVSGDSAQLARVVANLLENALRHGGPNVSVTLREVDDEAVLTVADDGPGIPPAQREEIFERFARVDEARSVAHGGAGLGLAIARELVELNRGSVAVDPDYVPGVCFVVRLPLAGAGLGQSAGDP